MVIVYFCLIGFFFSNSFVYCKALYMTWKFHCREYKLLNLLEFCSTRKRMSVIVSNEDGKIFLLCKGADRYVIVIPINLLLKHLQ